MSFCTELHGGIKLIKTKLLPVSQHCFSRLPHLVGSFSYLYFPPHPIRFTYALFWEISFSVKLLIRITEKNNAPNIQIHTQCPVLKCEYEIMHHVGSRVLKREVKSSLTFFFLLSRIPSAPLDTVVIQLLHTLSHGSLLLHNVLL